MPNDILPESKAIETLLAAGRATGQPLVEYGGIPLMVIPQGYKIESLKSYLPPKWVEQRVSFEDAVSFCEYVKLFKTWRTQIFGQVSDQTCSLIAVIDYHSPKAEKIEATEPGRTAHRATLGLRRTTEWAAWMANDRQPKPQTEFALFLEENERLFRSPSGADLREMVLNLEGHCNARYNSVVRLQNGAVKMNYEEDVELRGSHGEATGALELPGEFLCGIAPFEYVGPYEVRARLRYKLSERRMSFWYETITPHLIVRDAAQTVLKNVEEATGIKVLLGSIG